MISEAGEAILRLWLVRMEVLFKIIRQQQNSAPVVQTYLLEAEPGNTILDCLNRIKWEQDGTLAFRKNCRNTICGSCAMRINGRSALACKENVGSELARLQQIACTKNKSQCYSRNYDRPFREYACD